MLHEWLWKAKRSYNLCTIVIVQDVNYGGVRLQCAIHHIILDGCGMVVMFDAEGVRGMYCSPVESWSIDAYRELTHQIQDQYDRETGKSCNTRLELSTDIPPESAGAV